MRKVKLQMQLSLDGYVAGPNGEMDWMTWDWDDKLKADVTELTASVDTILLGRKMAGGFISHWAAAAANPEDPTVDYAKIMDDYKKVVFTKTLHKSEWENVDLATGDLATEIKKLKAQNGKDIIVYGGASFVSSLIKEKQIDEFNLFINPAVIGSGLSIFKDVAEKQDLKLISATPYACGIVRMRYERK